MTFMGAEVSACHRASDEVAVIAVFLNCIWVHSCVSAAVLPPLVSSNSWPLKSIQQHFS
jgi:hypothetical protein